MKYLLYILLSAPLALNAQRPLTGGKYFTLNLNASDYKNQSITYGISTYLNFRTDTLHVGPNGRTSIRIPLQGDLQDFSLLLPANHLDFYVQADDTIDVTQNSGSVGVHGRTPRRDSAIQASMRMKKQLDAVYSPMMSAAIDRKMPDSSRFHKIEACFAALMDTLHALRPDPLVEAKLGADMYYYCQEAMLMGMLLPQYHLRMPGRDYLMLSEEDFHSSTTYRWFLFNYLRVGQKLVNGYEVEGGPEERSAKIIGFSPAWDDYYSGLMNLKIYEMRDWFITNSILMDFASYGYEDVAKVYADFRTKVRVKDYADTLEKIYLAAGRIRPGAPAPDFTLRDQNDRPVSLTGFRGKVVVIDFWGVYCGACIQHIRHSLPALHDAYKNKNVVFLNVCVDVDTAEWRQYLTKSPVDGVNVLAPGWTRHPVCRTYGVESIPHYFIIGTDGTIVRNNGFSSQMKEAIDEALAKTGH